MFAALSPASVPRDPAVASTLRQVSLARLTEFRIVPKRDLGQNFLIDDNILAVILGFLQSRPDDVALEVGAGLGVLTAALSGVASHVHAFEVDTSLEGPLRATLGAAPNVALHFQDILKASLEALDPTPTLCASNLPYSVAGPFLVEALQRLPAIRRYCVMVQREVAERIAASPGTKRYGILSVWVQLYSEIARMRPLSRTIFYPQPNVDSSLIVLNRLPEDRQPSLASHELRRTIQAAFGQRRKTLVNSLAGNLELSRAAAASAVQASGLPPDIRAERLRPADFVSLTRELQFMSAQEGEQ